MKAVNDELLCITAQMMIDAKGTDDFEVSEIMLRNMLRNRETTRNLELLKNLKGVKCSI